MAKKILVPVYPSDAFYDAVVAARDIVATEGGIITFLFTRTRPSEAAYDDAESGGHPSELDVSAGSGGADGRQIEIWRDQQVEALDEARRLLTERGVGGDRIDYSFADDADESAAEAIAGEAAAGAYDLVVLSRAYFSDEVDDSFSSPEEVADAIQSLSDGVKLLVT